MDFKSQKLKSALKSLIKRKGLTYEDLAEQLDVSVPTVKRIMGPEEMTLSRFLQLCQIANVDLGELEAFANEGTQKEERFTEEQEKFLARNRGHFAYLLKLFEEKTPRQIAAKFNLSQRSTDRYLIALEKMGLIRVTAGQKVKPAFHSMPTLAKGPLAKVYFEGFISSAMRFFIESIKDTLAAASNQTETGVKAKFGVNVLKVTRPTYENWVQESERAVLNLQKIASFEEKTKPESELMSMVVLEAHCLVKPDNPRLKPLSNVLGDIPAL